MSALRVGVFGASGFVGSVLQRLAVAQGHEVAPFSRRERPGYRVLRGVGDLEDLDAVINLAGEPILGLWTASRKREILQSRVQGTRRIVEALASGKTAVRTLINASAIGYYGDTGDRIVDESSPAGSGFLAETCKAWETEALAAAPGTRVVTVRIGFVIGRGGAMALIRPVFQLGLGGRLGSGRQWMSCIHVDDVAGMILHALRDETVSGPLNAVIPTAVTNSDFTRAVAASVRRPAIFPAPAFILRTLLGDLSHVLLDSSRVNPAVAVRHGYSYQYPDLDAALGSLNSPGTAV